MTSASVSRWSRMFVATGVTFFLAWQVAFALGFDRRVTVLLGLQGFVFSVVFGKAYALVPSYFARELEPARAPAVQYPLTTLGTIALLADALGTFSPASGTLGAGLWLAGSLVFVGAIGYTVRDNLSGAETGTGDVNVHRRRVDRVSNAFVPVVLAYLLVGASLPLLRRVGVDLPGTLGYAPAASHVLAAGTAALLVFAVGFRLLPRFLVTTPRLPLVGFALAAGAVGPAALATDFLGGTGFRLGAAAQATAVVAFAVAYLDMYRRSDRRRVGFHAIAAGALFGVGAVTLGLSFAFVGVEADLLEAHYRLALLGFLGLTIVGVTYQFYPPAIGTAPGVDDRTATASIALLAGGLVLEAIGFVADRAIVVRVGSAVVVVGALCYAYVLFSLFRERR